MADPDVNVTRNDAEGWYEIRIDGDLAGYTEFRYDAQGRMTLPHTAVIPSYRGRGIAGALAEGALRDAATRGERVVPLCPVVQHRARDLEIDGLLIDWPDED